MPKIRDNGDGNALEMELLEGGGLRGDRRLSGASSTTGISLRQRRVREDAGAEPPSFNYKQAFAFMSERRVQRTYKGVYMKYSMWMQLFTWLLVAYILSVVAADVIRSATQGDKYLTWDNTILLLACFLVVFVIVEIALVIRWLIYWVILAELVMFLQTGSLKAMFWLEKNMSSDDKAVRNGTLTALGVMEFLTILTHCMTHHIYPWVVRKQFLDPRKWWLVRAGRRQNSFTYRSKARICTDTRSLVRYCGGLNAKGEPHGYGIWTDSSYHGEHLRGVWENGVPVGPFTSREHGSGYCFVNLRIAYCQNRGEAKRDQIYFFPTPSKEGLQWGVASVECSVSGGFFRFLPAVRHLTSIDPATAPRDARECLPILRTPICELRTAEESRTMSSHRRGATFLPAALQPPPPSSLLGHGFTSGEREALVFLHGYNCSVDYALNRLGQLLALGDFPPHIHPFIFSWPSGGTLAYFQARSIGCESEETALDFTAFLKSLMDAGYKHVNIVAHSMGARIYFYALQRGLLDDIFVTLSPNPSETPQAPGRRMTLSTLTLCNPDYERHAFVRPGGGYDLSRQFCDLITVYGDRLDNALIWSEIFSRESVFDALVPSMGKRIYTLHRDVVPTKPPSSSPSSRWSFFQQQQVNERQSFAMELGVEAAEMNEKCAFPGVYSLALNHLSHDSDSYVEEVESHDNRRSFVDNDQPREFLDVDVVDTTWMDNNVHAVRHNYFNLNPTLIDDLRQVIVSKRRARFRAGLLHTVANVHIFLVAPSHIKND